MFLFALTSCSLFSTDERTLTNSDGVRTIENMDAFRELSTSVNIPGAFNQSEVKFLILNAHTSNQTLYFINSKTHEQHYSFLTNALEQNISPSDFKSKAYYVKGKRDLLVGELLYYDRYQSQNSSGIFTIEFWPSDNISYENIALCYSIISEHLSSPNTTLAYHPRGATQEFTLRKDSTQFNVAGIPSITTNALFQQFPFIPYNTGESYGYLRSNVQKHHGVSDIILLNAIPNTLSHVSGIVTDIPQTPLSHINLIARQNNIPNAYIRNPFDTDSIMALVDTPIHFKVTDTEYSIEPSTDSAVYQYLESFRPAGTQVTSIDRVHTLIKKLSDISFNESSSYGAKTSNVAELSRVLPDSAVPSGYGIPFSYYMNYMESGGLFDAAKTMIADSAFTVNAEYRRNRLKEFRERIKEEVLDQQVIDAFENEIRNQFTEGTTLRCRSSTNNEDLEGFNGAGLYNSYTHHLDEGALAQSIKQVWAGLWTYRAFQERSFYRVDHFEVAMGVLVHPNYTNEKSNGVAVTKNIYDTDNRGFYVNVQQGEDLVTHPEAESIPEELLISAIGENNTYATEYIRYSNLIDTDDKILSTHHITELTLYMELIQNHFLKKYNQQMNFDFSMEIEFKITDTNTLVIKQARPWL